MFSIFFHTSTRIHDSAVMRRIIVPTYGNFTAD